jgi:hypothetical protein
VGFFGGWGGGDSAVLACSGHMRHALLPVVPSERVCGCRDTPEGAVRALDGDCPT